MKLKVLKEPTLQFGNGSHICPKAGIETLGVYDTNDKLRQSELRLGVVGRGEGVDLMDVWLNECESGIEGKDSDFHNLFRGFGGFNKQYGFHSSFLYGPALTRTIQKSELNKASRLKSRDERVNACVDLYYEQIRFLSENRSVDVVLCVVPDEIFNSITKKDDSKEEIKEKKIEHNFRRLIKAKSMHLRVPLQLVLEKSIGIGKPAKGQQDDASRAWNFCTALYYKGNRTIPWRLSEEEHKPKTCYVGVGFYKSRDKTTISTSLAQVFDEFGHGVILRGTPVSLDKKDRRPFMNSDQAYELLISALDEYDHALMQMPARVVIHKTSNFKESEIKGFSEALKSKGIRVKDFVTVIDEGIQNSVSAQLRHSVT